MTLGVKSSQSRIQALENVTQRVQQQALYDALGEKYASDPVGFAEKILKVNLTDEQKLILRLLLEPPYKVLAPAGHSVGKSFCGAVAILWWFFCRAPSVVISTAPTERDVVDIVWGEVRLLSMRAGLPCPWIGPRAPHIFDTDDHYAKGYTASKGESFSGRHRKRMLFVFDEAAGVEAIYFETFRTMFDPTQGHAALAIFNPTSTTSHVYTEDLLIDDNPSNPPWHRVRLSALNHPNVLWGLAKQSGKDASQFQEIPGAVSVGMVDEWVRDWCDPIDRVEDVESTDVLWPPTGTEGRQPRWYRPGAIFQSRALGLWPTTGDGVWSDALFAACLENPAVFPLDTLPQIGCDTAMGKGEDFHAIHSRWGNTSFAHETSNTMDAVRIADRLRQCAKAAADFATMRLPATREPVDPKKIHIKIDDDGTGGAILAILKREGYTIIGIGAGTKSTQPTKYPRRRDELWFALPDRAKKGKVCFSLLDKPTQRRLKQQLLAPVWDTDLQGRRVVEIKDKTKLKIGRSPDDADAVNLSFCEVAMMAPSIVEPDVPQKRVEGPYYKRGPRWA